MRARVVQFKKKNFDVVLKVFLTRFCDFSSTLLRKDYFWRF